MVIKGEGYERLYVGKVVGDPKVSQFGEKQYTKTRFGVRYKDGENGIIDVDTKFELAECCKDLKKFDSVMVFGKLDNWEDKEGNKRWFLDCWGVFKAMKKEHNAPKAEQTALQMTEVNDEELPF